MGSSDGEGSMCSGELEAWRIKEEEELALQDALDSIRFSKEETGYGSNYTDSELSYRSFEDYEDYTQEELEQKVEVANCTIMYLVDENNSLERKVASLEAEKEELAEINQNLRNNNEELDLRVQCLEAQVSQLLDKVFRLENENAELADRVVGLSIVVPR